MYDQAFCRNVRIRVVGLRLVRVFLLRNNLGLGLGLGLGLDMFLNH